MQALLDPIESAITDAIDSLGQILARLPTLIAAALVVLVFVLLARLVSSLTRDAVRASHLDPSLRTLLDQLVTAGIVLFGIAIGFAVLGLNLSTIAATFGVAGLVVGFALKDILENFIAGVLILWRRPFRIDDQIRIATNQGTVRDITFRSTTLETEDGIEVLIPNAQIINQAVYNLTSYGTRRTTVTFTVPRATDLELTRNLTLRAVQDVPGVLAQPSPELLLLGGTGDSYELHLRYWTLPQIETTRLIESRVRRAVATVLESDELAEPAQGA